MATSFRKSVTRRALTGVMASMEAGVALGPSTLPVHLKGGIDSRVCQIYSFRQVIFVRMDWGLQQSIGEERSKLWSNYFLFQPF
jgi:hypothetical protein